MNSTIIGLNLVRHGKALSLCSVAGLFLIAAPAASANWQISPNFGAGVGFDDNVRLSDVTDLTGTETYFGLNAEATFAYKSELTQFKIMPRLTSKRFEKDSELDADDLLVRFNFNKRGVKSNFRIRGNVVREAVRTGERLQVDFETEDPDDIETDNSGLVVSTGERDRIAVFPEFDYKLSQRYSLGISGRYFSNSYDNRSAQFLSGYQDYSLDTSLSYQRTERDDFFLYVGGGNYETETQGEDSKNSEFGIGYKHQLSERTQFRVRLGSSNTENDEGSDDTNAVGQISIVHRYLRTTAFASYGRSVSGSGDGSQSLIDSFNLNLSRPFSPTITLNAGAYGYTSERFDSQGSVKRDYVQIRTSANWKIRRNVRLSLDYRFTHVKRKDTDSIDNEDSNEISLWISWAPKPLFR